MLFWWCCWLGVRIQHQPLWFMYPCMHTLILCWMVYKTWNDFESSCRQQLQNSTQLTSSYIIFSSYHSPLSNFCYTFLKLLNIKPEHHFCWNQLIFQRNCILYACLFKGIKLHQNFYTFENHFVILFKFLLFVTVLIMPALLAFYQHKFGNLLFSFCSKCVVLTNIDTQKTW